MTNTPLRDANRERQAQFRARQALRISRSEEALTAIVARLDGRPAPLAVEVRLMALKGLGRE